MAIIDQIRAQIAAADGLSQAEQEAIRDRVLTSYSSQDLAAAFPEYGSVADYDTAVDGAQDRSYIDWMVDQPNPYGQGTLASVYEQQGIDPFTDPRVLAQAQEERERADRRYDMFDQAGVVPEIDLTPWLANDVRSPSFGGVAVGGSAPKLPGGGSGTGAVGNGMSSSLPSMLRGNFSFGESAGTPQGYNQSQVGANFGPMQSSQANYKSDLIKSLRASGGPEVSNAGFTQYQASSPQYGSVGGMSSANSAFNPGVLTSDAASAQDVADWNEYSAYRTNSLGSKTPIVGFKEWLSGGKVSGIPEPVAPTQNTYNTINESYGE